ncbi:MAG: nitroreductase family protein [Roseibium sp.]|uniref:nitroreductase family protein n=1 Tax=Roseibium sp. TaxID=1936156 RepID=UPI001B19591F|nr:nitroreductase family protein [Roseibium sp.]MBO6891932.1 nitroreductase family protein [Roseibium sp.]MBO6929201.1 nitroreductase family protein [Roseibium sp.]
MIAKSSLDYKPLPLPDRRDISDSEMQARAEAFLDDVRTRHTVRDFSDRPVDQSLIETCIRAAGTAPSGANHQPWHFVAISKASLKRRIREAAEEEERKFYAGGAGDEWIRALEPIGTNAHKPHLEDAPWLIVIFAQRWGTYEDGTRYKHYYVPESVGIATGLLITALHHAGLSTLTHTPNPMRFLNEILERPEAEKPVMILAVGHPAENATVPAVAKLKKPLEDILTAFTETEQD